MLCEIKKNNNVKYILSGILTIIEMSHVVLGSFNILLQSGLLSQTGLQKWRNLIIQFFILSKLSHNVFNHKISDEFVSVLNKGMRVMSGQLSHSNNNVIQGGV